MRELEKGWGLLRGLCFVFLSLGLAESSAREVSSLLELVRLAERNNQTIRMKPGTYRLSELASEKWIRRQKDKGKGRFIEFSGSGNRFQMQGVKLIWETKLRERMRPPWHTGDIVITGDRNLVEGLEIQCVGDGVSHGGQLLEIAGRGNVISNCAFEVRGSSPYGYGDVFGKGGNAVIFHYKHSGILVKGDGTQLKKCKVKMRSYGHGIFLQEDAANVLIEDCLVEGELRKTEDMLAETEGPAYKKNFETVFRNREGEKTLLPGYMKSLCEDGFRTYGEHRDLVIRRCVARNTRAGFELRMDKARVLVEDCRAIGCERGFWLGSRATVKNCQADARFGPVLFLEGEDSEIDIEVLPETSDRTVHGLAMIHGRNHEITLRVKSNRQRDQEVPIWVGYSAPSAGEGMARFGERRARRIEMRNETTMPVRVGESVEGLRLTTRGVVEEDKGKRVRVKEL